MPRLVDPRPRSADDHNPLANLLNFDSIDSTVLSAGSAIAQMLTQFLDEILDGVVDFIFDLTGIDLSSFADLLTGLFDFTGIDLSSFTGLFDGIFGAIGLDLPGLGALDPLSLFSQLFSFLPGLGDGAIDPISFITDILNPTGLLATITGIVEAITGSLGDLGDLGTFFTSFFGILSGGAFGGTGDPLSFITDFFSGIPILGDLIEAITGSVGGLGDLTSFFTDFFGIFGGAGGLGEAGTFFTSLLSILGDPSGLLTGFPDLGDLNSIPILGPLIGGLIDGGQPLNVLNLFGQIPQSLFGLIPASSIGGNSPNLLNNGPFDGSISMDGSGIWTWDATDGHSSNGCATTTANSTLKALLSNAVDVQEGQELDPSVWAKTVSYTGTSTPIRLAVRTYLDGAQVSTANVQSVAGSGLTSWTQLSGTYTVPAGVDQVRIRLVVDTTATGGTVKFDDATLTKPGNGPFDGILDLFGLGGFDDLFGVDVEDIWSTIITTIFNPLGLLDMQGVPIIGDILDIFGGASDAGGAGDFFSDLLGLLGSPTAIGTGTPTVDTSIRIPIISGLLDGLFGGFTQIFDVPADQDSVADAANSVNSTLVGAQSAITQLAAAFSPGNQDHDEFERTSSGNWDTGQWMVLEDGNGGDSSVDGHNGVWLADYTKDSEMVARRLTMQAATNNQATSVVLASGVGNITDGNAALDLWLRCTNFTTYATRTGLRMRFWGSKAWELAWFNSGTKTVLTSGTHSKSMASGTFTFEAGDGLVPRVYTAKINNEPIMADFAEVGTTSQFGASNLWRGVGLRGEFSLLGLGLVPAIQVQSGKINQWTGTG